MRRNSISHILALLGGIGVLCSVAPASAQGKLEEVLARGKLIVGTGSTNPPWHFVDESGKMSGFDVDIARIVAKGLFDDPEKVEFVTQSSDSRIPNIVTDKVDITCQFMTVTAQRAQQMNFTIPYYREGVGLLLSANGTHKTYDDLKAAGAGRHHLRAAECLCRGDGASGAAGGDGRPV